MACFLYLDSRAHSAFLIVLANAERHQGLTLRLFFLLIPHFTFEVYVVC